MVSAYLPCVCIGEEVAYLLATSSAALQRRQHPYFESSLSYGSLVRQNDFGGSGFAACKRRAPRKMLVAPRLQGMLRGVRLQLVSICETPNLAVDSKYRCHLIATICS